MSNSRKRAFADSLVSPSSEDNSVYKVRTQRDGQLVKKRKNHSFDKIHFELIANTEEYTDEPELNQHLLHIELTLQTFKNNRDPARFPRITNFHARIRTILVDWIMQICSVFRLHRTTFHFAMDYIDRYVTRVPVLATHNFQLMGVTCLFIAAKLMEMTPPPAVDLAYMTAGACTAEHICFMEQVILNSLDWDMQPTTVTSWLYRYLKRWSYSVPLRDRIGIFVQLWEYVFYRASQIIDLCCLDDGILLFPYSFVAASCLYYILSPEKAFTISGLTFEDLERCVKWLGPFVCVVDEDLYCYAFNATREYCYNQPRPLVTDPHVELNSPYTVQTHDVYPDMLLRVTRFRRLQESLEQLIEKEETAACNGVGTTAATSASSCASTNASSNASTSISNSDSTSASTDNDLNQPSTSGLSKN